MNVFSCEQKINAPIEKVFSFFADAKNLENITPPFLCFRIMSMSTPQIQLNTEIWYQLRLHGFPLKWQTLISKWEPPYCFVDELLSGPYKRWHHTHTFERLGENTLIKDRVEYELPLGKLGSLVAGAWVRRDVENIFKYRQQTIEKFLI